MKILFVDDETMILNSLKRGLRKLDYDFYYVTSGESALELMKTTPIDIVFSDMKMPKMSGLELLKTIEKTYPDVIKVILSGYAQLPQLIATINQSTIFKYVAKPWDLYGELIPVLEECVEYAAYKHEQKKKNEKLSNINSAYQNIFKSYSSKVATKEQSLDIIKIYQQIFMKSMREMMYDQEVELDEKVKMLDAYKMFIDYFIESVQKKEIYFEPQRILNEVQVELKRQDFQLEMHYKNSELPKGLYVGRGLHLKPTILALFYHIVPAKSVGSIKIEVEEVIVEDQKRLLVYNFSSSKRIFSQLKDISHVLLFYKSILKIFGGDLEIKFLVDQVVLTIKVLLIIDEQEEGLNDNINRG
ncbi:MAG: response regulator [Clostridia bacterium]|nr:response regulator [Clostridia bacterium]